MTVTLVAGASTAKCSRPDCQLCAQLELDLGEDRYLEGLENGTPIKETSA